MRDERRVKDPDGKAVYIEGNFTEGYKVIGPFDSWDDACEHAEDSGRTDTWVVTLEEPEEEEEFLSLDGQKI